MARAIDTLGQAARHGMVIQAECQGCGNIRYYMASDMMSVYGGGRDIRSLKFKCGRCQPKPVRVEVLEVDYDRMPRINVCKPSQEPFTGMIKWTSRRFKGQPRELQEWRPIWIPARVEPKHNAKVIGCSN